MLDLGGAAALVLAIARQSRFDRLNALSLPKCARST